MRPVLLVPGYQGSGPGHWQTLWEAALPQATRVEMPDWEHPEPEGWLAALAAAVAACAEAPILVGHSLGCITIVHWALRHAAPIHGALLAAPADVERPGGLEALRAFGPIPQRTLPFPTILAASANDVFMTHDRAVALGQAWGARRVDLGAVGHLNVASGHGPWIRGVELLAELR